MVVGFKETGVTVDDDGTEYPHIVFNIMMNEQEMAGVMTELARRKTPHPKAAALLSALDAISDNVFGYAIRG